MDEGICWKKRHYNIISKRIRCYIETPNSHMQSKVKPDQWEFPLMTGLRITEQKENLIWNINIIYLHILES